MEGLIWAEATWIRCLALPSISREMSGNRKFQNQEKKKYTAVLVLLKFIL